MHIRPAQERDIPALITLRQRQLMDEGQTPDPDITENLRRYFTASLADGSLALWVAEDSGAVVATGGVCFYPLPPNFTNPTGMAAYITSMYTAPSHRGQGIASALLGLAVGEAKACGCLLVRLHASAMGRSVYERFGFVAAEGMMVYRVE